jgi:hypothetical protein
MSLPPVNMHSCFPASPALIRITWRIARVVQRHSVRTLLSECLLAAPSRHAGRVPAKGRRADTLREASVSPLFK